jgi:metal-sulfur cluster biosynthetic enzyme
MNSKRAARLRELIITQLRSVIDPETGADVVCMRLIEDLEVTGSGQVSYVFRPSSPVCPLAVYLVQQIKLAVSQVPGIVSQTITVNGHVAAEQLTILINKEE